MALCGVGEGAWFVAVLGVWGSMLLLGIFSVWWLVRCVRVAGGGCRVV